MPQEKPFQSQENLGSEEDLDKMDFYKRLGISRDASHEEIKIAYRALSLTLHPDIKAQQRMFGGYTEFALITEAYNQLKNPVSRERYDATLPVIEEQSQPSSFYKEKDREDLTNYYKNLSASRILYYTALRDSALRYQEEERQRYINYSKSKDFKYIYPDEQRAQKVITERMTVIDRKIQEIHATFERNRQKVINDLNANLERLKNR